MTVNPHLPLRCGVLGTGLSARMFCERIQLEPQLELLTNLSSVEWLFVGVECENRAACIRQALLQNQHVVTTAPFTVSAEELRGLMELAQAHQRRIEVWLPQRSDAEFLVAQQITQSGEIGDLRRLRYELRQLSPWMVPITNGLSPNTQRAGEEFHSGVFQTFGWVAFDQLLDLVASPVSRVFARSTSRSLMFGQVPGNSFDARIDSGLFAYIEFANGCEAQLDIDLATTSTSGPNWWLQGTRGGYDRGRISQTMPDGELFDVPLSRSAADPMQRLIDRLKESDQSLIAARYAHWIAVSMLASALQQSARSNQVVTLSQESNR